MIPFNKPYYNQEEVEEVKKIIDSRWTTLGKKTEEFEDKFAEFVGAKYAVGTNSCTTALTMALKVNGVEKGHEVIVPSLTFVSTVFSIIYAGAKPVFADVDRDTLCITDETIEPLINRRTKAVLPVHLYGYPTKINFPVVVEDCAHGVGSYDKNGKHVGSENMGCFSFHTLKSISAGDGGIITTNNPIYNKILREMRWFGATKDTYSKGNSWLYDIHFVGDKGYMNDISAAIANAQFNRVTEFTEKKRKIAKKYRDGLEHLPYNKMFPKGFEKRTSALTCAIRVPERDDLIKWLAIHKIGTSVHYRPVHMFSIFKNSSPLPVTESEWKKIICLPSFFEMTDDEQDYIIDTIKEFYKKKRS